MKKVSTVAAQRSTKISRQKLTVGLDLGDRSSWYCVLDETGQTVLEQKLSTTPKAMQEVFGAMPRSRIALETGMHSPWISRLLTELGHEVIVAHARNVSLREPIFEEQKAKPCSLRASLVALCGESFLSFPHDVSQSVTDDLYSNPAKRRHWSRARRHQTIERSEPAGCSVIPKNPS